MLTEISVVCMVRLLVNFRFQRPLVLAVSRISIIGKSNVTRKSHHAHTRYVPRCHIITLPPQHLYEHNKYVGITLNVWVSFQDTYYVCFNKLAYKVRTHVLPVQCPNDVGVRPASYVNRHT